MRLSRLHKIALLLLAAFVSLALYSQPVWAETPKSPPAEVGQSIQPYLDRVKDKVTTFRLKNGLKFIVLERHQAPVVALHTYADVGGSDEPVGQTGVAHYLEHLAFKGTRRIGATDYESEEPLLEQQDKLFDQIQAAKAKKDEQAVQSLTQEFAEVSKQAGELVKQNEMGQIINQEGGVGLNATTSSDATRYFYSLPANKLELWMSLESERFLEPVFREFYKEKEVILEERRLRTDNSPIGKMVEVFLGEAFDIHPYLQPVIGYEKDLRNLTRQNVQDFFDTYYGPGNLTIAVVGDVNPKEVKKLAKTYFGRFKSRSQPPKVTEVEPPQQKTKSVTLELKSQPWYLEGYHRPAISDPDHVIYELIASLLSDGRTSRLYKSLVESQKIALSAEGFSGFPGDKYPNLMLFYALTAPGHTVDEVATALNAELAKLKTELVDIQDLDRLKTQARASLLRSLDSNSGMARLLTEYEVKTGDWRNLFSELEKIESVTPEDVQRIAQATFKPENRTVGYILSKGK
ncbi:pitrilysin family protein [Acaryochloris sp. CCMEE 5410]|uniref:M16 family metallopeptidase n=1 Tax=Acaryochloris sp. CCMEE 5410 TaxID=310037 RepID=UPI000584984D|nr:insulinase family protein [Acaryochloris sp. CCMEE 5410]